jgi:uncharacterized membrane protein
MRYARLTYALILSGTAAWCALLLAAPVAASTPRYAPFGALLYGLFSPLCHQIDGRSFHLLGEPLAVCGRCSAIYFGFLSGTILYPFAKGSLRRVSPGRMFLVVAVIPMLVDVALDTAGVYASTNAVHALTGAWFGVLLPFVVIPGATEGINQLFGTPNPHAAQPEKGLIDA